MDKVARNITKVVTRTASNTNKAITLEAATLARFADGASTCSMGDTCVLVTAVSQKSSKASGSFVPLTVDYRQKAAAAGRIPMTHLRRDVGTTEKEILTSRMIDRSIRGGFAKGFCDDTQVICNLLAVDGFNDPDIPAINGASATLSLSDIPWNGPIGAVRMGLIGELPVANPTRREQENSRLNLVLSANKSGNIIMMDGYCREPILIPDVSKAIKHGIKECQAVIEAISRLQKLHGKPKRSPDLSHMPTKEYTDHLMTVAGSQVREVLTNHLLDKTERDDAIKAIQQEATQIMKEKFPSIEDNTFYWAFSDVTRLVYALILKETGIRCDGRKFNEIRPITCSVDLHKPLHGSALFQRGQTQVFCSVTIDSPDAAFRTDSMTSLVTGVKEKNFMLHYEFPPFATNEIGRAFSMPGRREMGHGALAERSIRPMIPDDNDMTIRLNCEVMESNGSSSMASVCAGSMSLMDAGLKIKEHVAGVAMGMVGSELENDKNKSQDELADELLMTDILGFEDYIGDMDFKIAGTRRALTALQLDVKPADGISPQIVYKTIQKAHTARGEIISKMEKVIREPRKDKKDNHPVIKTIYIPPHKLAKFIGFGGSNLKKMMANIGVRISPYGEPSSGSIRSLEASEESISVTTPTASQSHDNFIIFAPNKDAMQEAEEHIKACLEEQKEPEFEFNAIYTAIIQEIRDNGVMISLHPRMNPVLLQLSQLDARNVRHPSALDLKVGDQIQVKYFGRDPATGQMRLSRKSLMMTSTSTKFHRTPLGVNDNKS